MMKTQYGVWSLTPRIVKNMKKLGLETLLDAMEDASSAKDIRIINEDLEHVGLTVYSKVVGLYYIQ